MGNYQCFLRLSIADGMLECIARAVFIGTQKFQDLKTSIDLSIPQYNAAIGDLALKVNVAQLTRSIKLEGAMQQLSSQMSDVAGKPGNLRLSIVSIYIC